MTAESLDADLLKDLKGLGKPPSFDGNDAEYQDFRSSFRIHMSLVSSVAHEMMNRCEIERNPISLTAVRVLGEAHLKCCMKMYYALALITRGSVRALIQDTADELVVVLPSCIVLRAFLRFHVDNASTKTSAQNSQVHSSQQLYQLGAHFQSLTTPNIDHHMCEAVGRIRSVGISSRAVDTRFVSLDTRSASYSLRFEEAERVIWTTLKISRGTESMQVPQSTQYVFCVCALLLLWSVCRWERVPRSCRCGRRSSL